MYFRLSLLSCMYYNNWQRYRPMDCEKLDPNNAKLTKIGNMDIKKIIDNEFLRSECRRT